MFLMCTIPSPLVHPSLFVTVQLLPLFEQPRARALQCLLVSANIDTMISTVVLYMYNAAVDALPWRQHLCVCMCARAVCAPGLKQDINYRTGGPKAMEWAPNSPGFCLLCPDGDCRPTDEYAD